MALSLSPAAVCQCFSLVSLCTSVADPNWIHISNSSDPNGRQLIYGVAFTLHAAQNLTDTAPLGGVNGYGMWLLYTLAGVCYSGILMSSSSFLFDFIGGGRTRPRLAATLHISAAVLCLAALGVCGACFFVIVLNLRKGLIGQFWDGGGGAGLRPYPGESFYITVLALFFSSLAGAFSLYGTSQPSPRGDYMPIAGEDGGSGDGGSEDGGREEPPQAREPGEEWGGEVFPE